MPDAVHQHHIFSGIPTVRIVRSELIMPFALPRIGVECNYGTIEQIVTFTEIAIVALPQWRYKYFSPLLRQHSSPV